MTGERIFRYVLYGVGTAAVLFSAPFVLRAFAPFVAAFLIAMMCQGLVRFLKSRLKISRAVSAAFIVTFIVAVSTGVAVLVLLKLFSQIRELIGEFPKISESLNLRISALYSAYVGAKPSLPRETVAFLDMLLEQLSEYSKSLSLGIAARALSAAKNFAVALPNMILFLIMFILGTFFFTKDYVLVVNFFKELFSERPVQKMVKVKKTLVCAFSSYLKAQLILMLICMFSVTVSMWIAGLSYPLVWGVACGLVDALPFFGTAAVLLTRAVMSLICGDRYSFAVLIVIQLLTFTVRQLLEPKIVSRQIGVHPILTLISAYIGLKFFGVWGVILAPILTQVAVNVYVSYRSKC